LIRFSASSAGANRASTSAAVSPFTSTRTAPALTAAWIPRERGAQPLIGMNVRGCAALS